MIQKRILGGHCLPPVCNTLQSAAEGSSSPSLMLLMLSFSSSLSTMAIRQFKLFATLAHTLSWKEQNYHCVLLKKKKKRDNSNLLTP